MDLYPAIDIRDGGAVRLTQGDFDRQTDYGDPLALALRFAAGGARWLHVVDLDAARTGQPVNRSTVLAIAAAVDVPVADRRRGALRGRRRRAAGRRGEPGGPRHRGRRRPGAGPSAGGAVSRAGWRVGLDYRLDGAGRTEVAVRGWEQGSGRTVAELLDELAGAGLAAVVVTAIDRDGTLAGPDLDGLADVLASTEHPGHRLGRGGRAWPTSRRWPPWPCRSGRGRAGRPDRSAPGRGDHRPGPGRRADDRRGGGGGVRTVRVIPCLDVDAGRVVKGVRFTDLFDAGDPVELAARYDAQGADELVFLDITASSDNRRTMVDVVSRTAEVVFIPFTVGGGVRSVEDARLPVAGRGRQGRGQHRGRRPARAGRRAGRRVREPVRGGGRRRPSAS